MNDFKLIPLPSDAVELQGRSNDDKLPAVLGIPASGESEMTRDKPVVFEVIPPRTIAANGS